MSRTGNSCVILSVTRCECVRLCMRGDIEQKPGMGWMWWRRLISIKLRKSAVAPLLLHSEFIPAPQIQVLQPKRKQTLITQRLPPHFSNATHTCVFIFQQCLRWGRERVSWRKDYDVIKFRRATSWTEPISCVLPKSDYIYIYV